MARDDDDSTRRESRDTGQVAFYSYDDLWDESRRVVMTYGGKPVDCGQCRLVDRYPFWRGQEERERYERAAKHMPVREYGQLDFWEFLRSVVEVAEGLRPRAPVKSMPEVRL